MFHCAAAAPSASNATGNEKLMHDVNVLGTQHVVAACQALGIGRLVYTSSASVVFEGRDLLHVDESAPIAKKPMDFYTRTKARPLTTRGCAVGRSVNLLSCSQAHGRSPFFDFCLSEFLQSSALTRHKLGLQIQGEQLVLEANGTDGLATVALRPSGIFGEGDPLFVPVMVENAKAGKLKYVIGNGANLMDFTYVGNVAHAHVLVRMTRRGHG